MPKIVSLSGQNIPTEARERAVKAARENHPDSAADNYLVYINDDTVPQEINDLSNFYTYAEQGRPKLEVKKLSGPQFRSNHMHFELTNISLIPAAAAQALDEAEKAAEKTLNITQKIKDNAGKILRGLTYSAFGAGALLAAGSVLRIVDESGLNLTPEILIGTIPVFSVQMIERAISDRILKYRAIGDVFLAHQKGGLDTLRADITLEGPYKEMWLLALLAIQLYSETEYKSDLPNLGQSVMPTNTTTNPIINPGQVQYESHLTFPIITHSEVMLDMFLQTLEWHQTVEEGGRNVIKCHLLFRKHIDPTGYKTFKQGKEEKAYLVYGDTVAERRRLEMFYDTIYKMINIAGETALFGLFDTNLLQQNAIGNDPYGKNIAYLVQQSQVLELVQDLAPDILDILGRARFSWGGFVP